MLGLGSVGVSPIPRLAKTTVGVFAAAPLCRGGALGIRVVSVALKSYPPTRGGGSLLGTRWAQGLRHSGSDLLFPWFGSPGTH